MALTSAATMQTLLGVTSDKVTSMQECADAADAAIKSYLRRSWNRTLCPNWPEADASQTFYMSGNNYPFLHLPFWPCTTLTSIYYDPTGYFGDGTNPFASTTLLTAGTDYVMVKDDGTSTSSMATVLRLAGPGSTASAFSDDATWYPFNFYSGNSQAGSLATSGRRAAVWSAGPGNLKITASFGFSTIPDDLAHAATLLAIHMFNTRERAGYFMGSENLGAYGFSIMQNPQGGWPEFGSIRQLLARYRMPAVI